MELSTVLLVDDDDSIRMIGELALTEVGGWTVHTASSGLDALQVAQTESIDAILLDVMMPGLDGIETLSRLKQSEMTRSIPVIFMTAKVLPGEVGTYIEAGALGVIAKPFDPMALPSEISAILRTEGQN